MRSKTIAEKKIKIKWLVYALAVVSVLLNFFFYLQLAGFKKTAGKYRVLEVLDGDSLVIDLDHTIRLADLDAPNTERCLSKEAKKRLEELVLGKDVEIETVGKDEFKRTIALIYVDGRLVNEIIVREGLAKYLSGQSGEKEIIRQAAEEAKGKRIGVWSEECYQIRNLKNPECTIKGNINKQTGLRFITFPAVRSTSGQWWN